MQKRLNDSIRNISKHGFMFLKAWPIGRMLTLSWNLYWAS